MAEIKIKKKAPIWPWILGLLIVGALVYFLVFANNTDDVDDLTTTTTDQVVEDTIVNNRNDMNREISEIAAYNNYVSDPDMDLDHQYSSNALEQLIAATQAIADKLNVDISADLSSAKSKAQEITENPASLKHADMIKDAGQSISKALKTIQSEKYPDLQSQYNEVEMAVSNIKKNTPTLDQKDEVRGFFTKAGNLLTSIQNNYGQER